ncbi:MAG: hypothetical protein HQ582_14050 [Planctomycetes bacterium]|nr:hypothetical protein [Planctomycetota bacterium]
MSLGLTESDLWVRAGWIMIHYLWVGALLGLAAVVCKWALKSATAHVRYLVALGWLATLALSPIAIVVWVGPAETAAAPLGSDTFAVVALDDATGRASSGAPQDGSEEDQQAPGLGSVAATLPWRHVVAVLPWIWLFGSPVVFAWSVAGLAGAERLRRLSSPTGDRKLDDLCHRLARSLKVSQEVSVRLSTRIASPVLAGILRPVILLPPALLSGLAPEQVEMLLLHELAHVRRCDNLVNFAQRTIESALFFHPVVWLVSRWVRQEREHCCDAMVLRRTGDGPLYAEALLAVVQKGLSARRLGMAGIVLAPTAVSPAVPGNLRSRIDRILGREDETMQVSRTLGALAPVVLVAAIVLAGSFGIPSGGAEPVQQTDVAVPSGGNEQDAETEAKDAAPPEDRPAQSQPHPQEAKPAHQGKVRWVNSRNRAAWINLGRGEGVEKGTVCRVYGPGKKNAPVGEQKGVLFITQILADHLMETRIIDENPTDPIVPGDLVCSPLWKAHWRTLQAEPSGDAAPIERTDAEGVAALRAELRKVYQERDELFEQLVKLTEELNKLTTEREKLEEKTEPTEKKPTAHRELGPGVVGVEWSGDADVGLYMNKDGSIASYRNNGEGVFTDLDQAGLEGVVLAVSDKGQVEISIGSDDGLSTGHRLEVYRREGTAGMYVGRIEVLLTRPDRSICRVLSEFLQRPIRKGDRVATKLSREVAMPLRVTVNIDAEGQISVDGKRITLEELPEALSPGPSRPASVHLSITAHSEVAQRRIVELLTKCAEARIEVLSVRLHPVTREDGPPAAPER